MKVALMLSLVLGSFVDVYPQEQQTFPYLSFMGQVLADNSYVNRSHLQSGSSNSPQCLTNLGTCCSSAQGIYRADWYFPDGSVLPFAGETYQSRMAQRVDLRRGETADSPSGIYICEIPTVNSYPLRRRIYVGIYASGEGDVGVDDIMASEVRYTDDGTPQFTLSCISTGGPATTVTWTRDSVTINEGRTETVLNDTVTAQYIHTLTLTGRLPGLYTCTVSNNKPSSDSFTIKLSDGTAPTSLRIVRQSSTSLLVSWSLAPLRDTTGYVIFYSELSSGLPNRSEVVSGGCATSHTLTGLSNGADYLITIVGTSYFRSEPIKSALIAPYLWVESTTSSSVVLSWTIGGSENVTYTIQWRLMPSTCTQYSVTVANGNTPHNVTGLEEGTEYVFNVLVTDATSVDEEEALSNSVVVSTTGQAVDTENGSAYSDGYILEICLNGLFACRDWVANFVEEKIQDISDDIIKGLSQGGYIVPNDIMFINEALICRSDSPNMVVFNSTIRHRSSRNSSDVLADIRSWVADVPALNILGVLMSIEKGCGSISAVSIGSDYPGSSSSSSPPRLIPTQVQLSITTGGSLPHHPTSLDNATIRSVECDCTAGSDSVGGVGLSIGIGAGVAVSLILIAVATVLIPFCGLKWRREKMRSFPLTSDVAFTGRTVPNIAYNSSLPRERTFSTDSTYDVVENQVLTHPTLSQPLQMAELAVEVSTDSYEVDTPPHIQRARTFQQNQGTESRVQFQQGQQGGRQIQRRRGSAEEQI